MTGRRSPAPDDRPVALTVAGSDAGGGAGVQADLAAMAAGGAFPTSVVTAVTAQNTRGVESVHVVPTAEVAAQFDAVAGDFDLRAAKTGMLATAEVVDLVADRAADLDCPVVVDPVMVAASGDRLLDRDAERAYDALVAEAALVTPNLDEAAVLTDVAADALAAEGVEGQVAAGEALIDSGARAALVKGGHARGDVVRDVLVTEAGARTFEHPRVDTEATHGSGCVLSSAVAARLARGDGLESAVRSATAGMERAVRYHYDVGDGPGPVNPLAGLRERAARDPTAEAVESVVRGFVERDVSPLVPEVGMNVVGATPYAEDPAETAAVEGRITRTLAGVKPNRGVRFGASSHVARFLLAAREHDPSLRFAVNCRYDAAVDDALDALSGPVASYDRGEEPDAVKAEEGSTMAWGADRAFASVEGTPVAVADPGEVGKEPVVKLLASDAETLLARTDRLLGALDAVR
ncbi:MAG: bifunctional hydroxymethylpyrimidine kinase/phosphomethylpyrimidine kinase [Halobacteriaceae archaeon]